MYLDAIPGNGFSASLPSDKNKLEYSTSELPAIAMLINLLLQHSEEGLQWTKYRVGMNHLSSNDVITIAIGPFMPHSLNLERKLVWPADNAENFSNANTRVTG
jgi:hypothetical protein